jgi:hypothetical protein
MERFLSQTQVAEVFRRANNPSCYWREERVQVREKDLCFLCRELFQGRRIIQRSQLGFEQGTLLKKQIIQSSQFVFISIKS